MALLPCDGHSGHPGMASPSKKARYAVRCPGCKKCRVEDNTIDGLQREIAAWADGVFPDRTVDDILRKLVMEEIPELLLSRKGEEFADVLLLTLDAAHKMGINVQTAVRKKLRINNRRKWKVNPATGLLNHVKGT